MRTWTYLLLFAALGCAPSAPKTARTLPPPVSPGADPAATAKTLIESFTRAWRGAAEMDLPGPLTVGFRVNGSGEYHVILTDAPGPRVAEGVPPATDIVYELDLETLRRLDRAALNVMTAMGQARADDPTPVVPRVSPTFAGRPDAERLFRRLSFHLWTREWPEVVRFGQGLSRRVHGGNAVALHYDTGFRSAWYQVEPGMHINREPRDQVNDHPQMFVVTRGTLQARLDGKERTLAEGEAVLVPAGMRHELWARANQYAELIFLAFGEGA